MREGNFYISPSFIKAQDAQELKAKMLANNIAMAMEVNYFSIQFAQNDWYAFYYENQQNNISVKNDTSKVKARQRVSKLSRN